MLSDTGHVRHGSASSQSAGHVIKPVPRRLVFRLFGLIPRIERVAKSLPRPAIPEPYIQHPHIPLSPELVVWLWFLRYTSLLIGSLVAMRRKWAFGPLHPYIGAAVLLALGYCLSPLCPRPLRLSTVLGSLAGAGHTAQTVHNSLEIAWEADIFDYVLISILFAIILRYNRSNHWHLIYPQNFRRAPYIANRASQIAYIVFAARRFPWIYLAPPLLLLGILILIFVTEERDYLRHRVAPRFDYNRLNPAARIPPEVQLRIFHLVRTRCRFSKRDTPVSPGEMYPQEMMPLGRWIGLSAACIVCRAWRDAATEVLYCDVFLPTPRWVVAFAESLEARPKLAPLVRRIALPVSERVSSYNIEYILRSCGAAVHFEFFELTTDVLDIPGLKLAAHRVRRLAATWGHCVPIVNDPAYEPRQCEVLGLLQQFPCLESLALCGARIPRYESVSLAAFMARRQFSNIHTIRLDACVVPLDALTQLMLALPRARGVALRNTAVRDNDRQIGMDCVFRAQLATLAELDVSSTHVRIASPPLELHSLSRFTALRTLALDAHMLDHGYTLPPALERLVLSFAPYSSHLGHTRRPRVFHAVNLLRRLLPLAQPFLHSVQIWDKAALAHVLDWKIGMFMLREMLGPSINVEVNILLPQQEVIWWRLRLAVQDAFGWLYDT